MSTGVTGTDFTFYDLSSGQKSTDINRFFPRWSGEMERLAVFSPHDDDGLLGAAYATLAAMAHGALAYVFIFCSGNFGYSSVEMKDQVVGIRRGETEAAYATLGLVKEQIIRLEYSDFGLHSLLGWDVGREKQGMMARVVPAMRRLGITRLLIPNPHREHLDHEMVAREGAYDGPQAGDPIIVDQGRPTLVKSVHVYSVWADFPPEDALVAGRTTELRANQVIRAAAHVERLIATSLRHYRSQSEIISNLIRMREERRHADGYIEPYLHFDPRPKLDFSPYRRAIAGIDALG